jgi:hypothetical protein
MYNLYRTNMNGRFSMNFTQPNSNNKVENVYRKGEAQYHNYSHVKRSTKIDNSIAQPSENILINEGIQSRTNTYTKPSAVDNNYVKNQHKMSTIPHQQAPRKVVGPGSMARFLMSPPTGSGCSACGGK